MLQRILSMTVLVASVCAGFAKSAAPATKAEVYVQAVREYCDKVLEVGRDNLGAKHTPLFVDGVEVETLEPVKWQ